VHSGQSKPNVYTNACMYAIIQIVVLVVVAAVVVVIINHHNIIITVI